MAHVPEARGTKSEVRMVVDNADNHQSRKIGKPGKKADKQQENDPENLIFVFSASQGFSNQMWDMEVFHPWLAVSSIVRPSIYVGVSIAINCYVCYALYPQDSSRNKIMRDLLNVLSILWRKLILSRAL